MHETEMARQKAAERIVARLAPVIAEKRMLTDPLMTFAFSGDASFYRLVPALVVYVESEAEVAALLAAAAAEDLPVTFRAAGTSLSGQAITQGVLAVLGDGWRHIDISGDASQVTLGPGTIVAEANAALKPHNRKIGPDPASQATAKIGGVVANNSSGMCCGVVQNTYHTMARIKLLLKDGTRLDSGDPASRDAFRLARPDLIAGLTDLAETVHGDNELVDLIRRKYAIKNTVGYSLNALVDFTDPIDILSHLMVGSEGTLGFVSQVTYNTVPDRPHKATALVPYATSQLTAKGIQALEKVGVSAAEFMERRALATVEGQPALAPFLPFLSETSPAVLVEIAADSAEALRVEIATATAAMTEIGPLSEILFVTDTALQSELWDIRRGLFASAGSTRPKGTVMLTEDVAVPIHRLADVVDDLRTLLDRHGYDDAIIFGHALAGNLHFQMSTDFSKADAVARFDTFMDALTDLIVNQYRGSLKAEHGTGRAIAPYVEIEWGKKAYGLMHRIKDLFDKEGLLNPGVLLNADDKVHIKNLKHMAPADSLIDLCIECGFCETVCPSAGLTLTPRQRIVVTRERQRLRETGEDADRLARYDEDFIHAGLETCAACNLCATRCPVQIETGTFTLANRARLRGDTGATLAGWMAANTSLIETATRAGIAAQTTARKLVGDKPVDTLASAARRLTGNRIPRVSASLLPGHPPSARPAADAAPRGPIVYFPACPGRMFGAPETELGLLPLAEAMLAILGRAGYQPRMPEKLAGACCGQPFMSKGFPAEAARLSADLGAKLDALADPDVPRIVDASTCAKHLKAAGQTIVDSPAFLAEQVLPHLTITRRLPSVAVHHNCSAQRMGEQHQTETVVAACAERIAVLTRVACCGYAGNKGMSVPELNAHALRHVHEDIPADCDLGISTVSTCATGLSEHAGIPFVGLASLLEYASRPAGA